MGKTMWAHGWRTSTESVAAKHNGVVEACGVGGSAIEGKNNTLRRRTISPTHGYVHTARTPTARRGGTGRKNNASPGGSPTARGLARVLVGGYL